MTAADRLAPGYEPRFDLDLALGQQGELFVANIAEMLGRGSGEVEVKTDAQTARTGNVYIEYECMIRGTYRPSGIATTQAKIWAFVLPANVLLAAPVENVKAVARNHYPARKRECKRGSHPTRGVAIQVGVFVRDLYQFELQLAAPPDRVREV